MALENSHNIVFILIMVARATYTLQFHVSSESSQYKQQQQQNQILVCQTLFT